MRKETHWEPVPVSNYKANCQVANGTQMEESYGILRLVFS